MRKEYCKCNRGCETSVNGGPSTITCRGGWVRQDGITEMDVVFKGREEDMDEAMDAVLGDLGIPSDCQLEARAKQKREG